MCQIFLYFQLDFEKSFIYNNGREIIRIRDFIDVPHFFNQISTRILYPPTLGWRVGHCWEV